MKIYHLGGIQMNKKQYKKMDCSKLKSDLCETTMDKNFTYFTREIPNDRRKLYSSAEIIDINRRI